MTENTQEISTEQAAAVAGSTRQQMQRQLSSLLKGNPYWAKMSESEQRRQLRQANDIAGEFVEKVVAGLASVGRITIPCIVESVTIKDGVKVVLTASKAADNVKDLGMLTGQPAYLTPNVTGDHMEADEIKPDPDQPELTAAGSGTAEDRVTPMGDRIVITETGAVCFNNLGTLQPLADVTQKVLEALADEFGLDEGADADEVGTEILRQVRENMWHPVSNRAMPADEEETPTSHESGAEDDGDTEDDDA